MNDSAVRFKLRHRLLLLAAVAVLPAFIIVVANHFSARAMRSAEVDAYAGEMTDVVRNEVVRGLSAAATLMLAMGRAAIVQNHDAAACSRYVSGLQRDLPTVLDIAVADETGAVYCHSGISAAADLHASVRKLAEADQPGLVVGNYTATPGGATLPIGLALLDAGGSVEGYIQLHVSMAELVRLVTAATQNVQESTTIVADRNGTVLLSLPEGYLEPGQQVPQPFAALLDADGPGTQRLVGPQATPQIVGFRPALQRIPIAAVFAIPEAPIMAPIDRAAISNSMIALGGAALAFLLAWFIGATFIQRPVRILERTIMARRAGDQASRTGLAGDRSELGLIGRSVDELFDELNRRDKLQRQTEEQRDLYAREVQHRVKNLLAIIQVIAKQSLARPDASPEVRAFESRISAIIRTNTKLLAGSDHAGLIEDLVHDAVAPFVGDDDEGRVRIAGPPIKLRSKVAAALSMALHELATNAVKYGALSVPQGLIEVRWSANADRFEMKWIERGGPPTEAPVQTGFGTILISRVLMAETRGKVATDFSREGFSFRLEAPIEDLLVEQDTIHPPAELATNLT